MFKRLNIQRFLNLKGWNVWQAKDKLIYKVLVDKLNRKKLQGRPVSYD